MVRFVRQSPAAPQKRLTSNGKITSESFIFLRRLYSQIQLLRFGDGTVAVRL